MIKVADVVDNRATDADRSMICHVDHRLFSPVTRRKIVKLRGLETVVECEVQETDF